MPFLFFKEKIHRSLSFARSVTGFLLLILGLASNLRAEQFGDFSYWTNGKEAHITGYTGTDENVTIPGKIGQIPVVRIVGGAFRNTWAKNIIVPESITSLENFVFAGCEGLKSVTLPASLTSIGKQAFASCKNLTGIIIPGSVTSIGGEAFYGCTGLTGITLPGSVTVIGDGAFADCTGLTGVTLPGRITSIRNHLFFRCTGLTAITLPGSATSIGNYAFGGCTALTGIAIPGSVTSIGNFALAKCKSLTGITIPGGVTSIGHYAFAGCTGLTGSLIPGSVTSISDYAFSDCTGLTGVTIPRSVTSIGSWAFFNCTSLKISLFEGNAPAKFGNGIFTFTASGFTISYYEGAAGFTSPKWRNYASMAVAPPLKNSAWGIESLTFQSGGAAILRVSGGRKGWTYTLQRSADLSPASWQSVGTAGPMAEDGALELQDTVPPPAPAFYRVMAQSP